MLSETYHLLKLKYGKLIDDLTISRVQIGLFFTGVELSNGFTGLASTDRRALETCAQRFNKDFGLFTPGSMTGHTIKELFASPEKTALLNFIRTATINAVTAWHLSNCEYKVITQKDPIELINLNKPLNICMVGAFHSYIRRIAGSGSSLSVLELDKTALPDEFSKYYTPSKEAGQKFSEADVVIITASAFVNNTLNNLLESIPSGPLVMVVGPTSGHFPEILFKRGVHVIGATRVNDTDKLFKALAEGAAGSHLFRNGACKICILNESSEKLIDSMA